MATDMRSRYRTVPTYDVTRPDGTVVPTVGIRPQPEVAASSAGYRVRVLRGEDMETAAHKHLGTSAVWWRVADANALTFPLDVAPGTALSVPTGADTGLVLRRRKR